MKTKTDNTTLGMSEKLGIISNFSTLLAAGISILDAIDSLLEDARGNQKKVLTVLREDIVQGKQVWETFSRFPQIFDRVTINIIKASEEAGTLDKTLKDLKDSIKKDMEFTDRIRSSLIYPMFIMGLFIAVLFMILVFVIPKISTVFLQLKVELPLPTKILIFMSTAILKYTIPLSLASFLFFALLYILYRTKKRMMLDILFSLPLISHLIKEIDLTRFTRSLYYLLSAGIPITSALDLAKEVVARSDIKKLLIKSQEMVASGKKFSEGLRTRKGFIPPIMVKIIEAGEHSGSLDKSMADISDYLDYQVSGTLKLLLTLLEPIMLVGVGLFVGGMMLAIIAPIYGLISQVGAIR